MNESVTRLFVEQSLASPGSANYTKGDRRIYIDIATIRQKRPKGRLGENVIS